jgi:hypothetical protein
MVYGNITPPYHQNVASRIAYRVAEYAAKYIADEEKWKTG